MNRNTEVYREHMAGLDQCKAALKREMSILMLVIPAVTALFWWMIAGFSLYLAIPVAVEVIVLAIIWRCLTNNIKASQAAVVQARHHDENGGQDSPPMVKMKVGPKSKEKPPPRGSH